ncbi:MAG TPA: putative phage abortive infection protein [Paracoccaceae bacterium]|nr:putative phage abortive infection protein [Paracoccaceae bacterium]
MFRCASRCIQKNSGPLTFAIVAMLVFLVMYVNYVIMSGENETTRGTFGDMFGFSNALFSGLAFAGIFYAFWLQRSEIRISKDELERTKILIEKQQEQINRQIEDGKILSFEQSFFKQIELLNTIISGIESHSYNQAIGIDRRTIGRDVISFLVIRLTENLRPDYEGFYERNGNKIGHYYRVMYNILSFIDRSCPSDKPFYSRIVRAQLSNSEVQILFHNCLSKYGEKMKPLVEKYSMLKHFSPTDAVAWEILNYDKYDPKAFGADGGRPKWLSPDP